MEFSKSSSTEKVYSGKGHPHEIRKINNLIYHLKGKQKEIKHKGSRRKEAIKIREWNREQNKNKKRSMKPRVILILKINKIEQA